MVVVNRTYFDHLATHGIPFLLFSPAKVVRDAIITNLTGAGVRGMVTPGQQQVQICQRAPMVRRRTKTKRTCVRPRGPSHRAGFGAFLYGLVSPSVLVGSCCSRTRFGQIHCRSGTKTGRWDEDVMKT